MIPSKHSAPRVVITGIGAITPLGLNAADTWQNLVNGTSAIGRISHFDSSSLPVHIAAEVKDFEPTQLIPPKEARRMSRPTQFAVAAAAQAVRDAGLVFPFSDDQATRSGVLIGTAMGGFDKAEQGVKAYARDIRALGLRIRNPGGASGAPRRVWLLA